MIARHPLTSLFWPALVGVALALCALALLIGVAHAGAVVVGDAHPIQVQAGIDPTAVVAWIGAISGGLSLLLTIAFQVLKVVAPLTKTPIDDEVRDAIGEILDHVRSAALGTTSVVVAQAPAALPAPAPDAHIASTSPGTLPTTGMLAVLLVGAGLALQPGCAAGKHEAVEAGHALVDCAKANSGDLVKLVAQLAAAVVKHGDWHAVEQSAEQAGVTLGGCALAALVAEYTKPEVPEGAVSRRVPGAADLALEQLRAKFGGVQWSVEQ